jgi:hypothetical protein
MDISEQEQQLLEIIREWSGSNDYRLLIEYRNGTFWVTLSQSPPSERVATGCGADFNAAWDKITPPWARKADVQLA